MNVTRKATRSFVLVGRGRELVAIECKWSADDFDPWNLRAFRRCYPVGEDWIVAAILSGRLRGKIGGWCFSSWVWRNWAGEQRNRLLPLGRGACSAHAGQLSMVRAFQKVMLEHAPLRCRPAIFCLHLINQYIAWQIKHRFRNGIEV